MSFFSLSFNSIKILRFTLNFIPKIVPKDRPLTTNAVLEHQQKKKSGFLLSWVETKDGRWTAPLFITQNKCHIMQCRCTSSSRSTDQRQRSTFFSSWKGTKQTTTKKSRTQERKSIFQIKAINIYSLFLCGGASTAIAKTALHLPPPSLLAGWSYFDFDIRLCLLCHFYFIFLPDFWRRPPFNAAPGPWRHSWLLLAASFFFLFSLHLEIVLEVHFFLLLRKQSSWNEEMLNLTLIKINFAPNFFFLIFQNDLKLKNWCFSIKKNAKNYSRWRRHERRSSGLKGYSSPVEKPWIENQKNNAFFL